MDAAASLAAGEVAAFSLPALQQLANALSAMRPEEALGAISRGSQLVVVGDPKQLPPTSFFSRQGDDDEEDNEETSLAQNSESILEAAMPLFKLRRLRWHYRSRHESLIAFSNKAFYDSNLVVYPSPHRESPEFGVKFVRVQRGRFVEQRNIEEAEVVAKAIEHHLLHRPDESLGVVAMNVKQAEQIDRALEHLAKQNPALQEALSRNEGVDEPLFVKNLENVQGDERDVIYISTTYGPMEIGGTVPQRFGPINGADGWRRLNVLFTRSKKRMQVFASFTAGDVLATGTSSRGVLALRDFLQFAETGLMSNTRETGKAPDSDFEVAVIEALERHGYQCEPQVGVAGFFIDLAVRDPGQPGRYLMGIECDGAAYHSAKSARDRDRLRQSVLEQLGCLNANPLMTGTAGTIAASANPVAGSVLADGFKASGSGLSGITTRWYKEQAAYGEAQCIELAGAMTGTGGYVYLQPTASVAPSSLGVGDILEMVSAPEVVGNSRGILGWEAELMITKPVGGTSTTIYYRSMDKYQEPFTLPANWKGALETQRYIVDLTETVVTCRMGLYLATGIAQDSKVKVGQLGLRKV